MIKNVYIPAIISSIITPVAFLIFKSKKLAGHGLLISKSLNSKKDSIIKKKLFSHIIRGIDWPINSSITISLGSDDEKDWFNVLFKK